MKVVEGLMSSPMASGGSIPAAINWVEAAMLGSVATAIATVAVGSIGYLAFTGRMELRRAAQTIFGCFILFAAPTIAAGLQGIATIFAGDPVAVTPSQLSNAMIELPVEKPAPISRPAYDPYAGAAIAPD